MSQLEMVSSDSAPEVRSAAPDVRGATYAVVILTAMNLLNYIDRYVPSAVKELFKKDLNLTDTQTSLPLTAFVFVYMIASPIFGSMSGRFSRKWLVALGVALWSAATAGAAFVHSFWTFMIARSLVGVGEAAYATLAPSIISDYFPPAKRNRILTVFYVAIPVGAAIGYKLGGYLGQHYGWRTAFLACGLPGIVTAALVLAMREPRKGQFDETPVTTKVSWPDALRFLKTRRAYINAVAGYTAVTFASGALADWFPAFLSRFRGFSVDDAAGITGVTAALGGLIGTMLGGAGGDWLRKRTRQPYLALSAWTMAGATVFAVLALLAPSRGLIWACMLGAQIMLWCYNAPINTIIVNAVPSHLRPYAISVSIFTIHALGDALSPSIVGLIADATQNLAVAMWIVPVAMVVGTAIWLTGWRKLPEEAQA